MNNKITEYKNNLKIKNKKLISENLEGYIGKRTYEVELANGKLKPSEQILKRGENGDAVVILPITSDNKYLLVVQSRPNIKEDGVAIEFPAGMIDKNESPLTAAKRELLEETGYLTDNIKEIDWYYQDQGCSSAIIHSYLALNCIKKQDIKLDDNEYLEPILLTEEELGNLINNKEISDANSKLIYYKYKLNK